KPAWGVMSGAGRPRGLREVVPGVLDRLAQRRPADLRDGLDVDPAGPIVGPNGPDPLDPDERSLDAVLARPAGHSVHGERDPCHRRPPLRPRARGRGYMPSGIGALGAIDAPVIIGEAGAMGGCPDIEAPAV